MKIKNLRIPAILLVGFIAVPFISFICTMFGLTGSSCEWIDQCIYNI